MTVLPCARASAAVWLTRWKRRLPVPLSLIHICKLRSAEVLLCEDGSHRLSRRAETPRDYFATLDFLPFMKPLLGEYNDD